MAAAPASLPVCISEGTSWTERLDPSEKRKDTLPHGSLQINDWGSHALQAFMHHAQFTDKHGTERSHWEFQGIPALLPCAHWVPTLTDTSQLKDRDKRDWEQWAEVSLCDFIPGSILATGLLVGCHSTHRAVQPHPAAVLVISHRQTLNAL